MLGLLCQRFLRRSVSVAVLQFEQWRPWRFGGGEWQQYAVECELERPASAFCKQGAIGRLIRHKIRDMKIG